ncbi:MAG TPA: BCAM0308 family protein [Pyrinomonadaceae bacterium]|nr:ATPase [Chloracidobacterium sp.]HRJ88849.1 BCAM0308 family protein [Pyrinomonadaceae bacterium]HRK50339.1 BCAM0308 family protein [Pyrinomonadaceae bacterium]
MKSAKRYTNATFTKRVDHDSGEHRGEAKMRSPAICDKCGSIFDHGRWVAKESVREILGPESWHPSNVTTCPACKQKAAGVAGGYLKVSGVFLQEHGEEIRNLIRNESTEAHKNNPLSTIISFGENNSEISIETTDEHLVQRIGKALTAAYAGDLTFDFSHENKVARVTWHRD